MVKAANMARGRDIRNKTNESTRLKEFVMVVLRDDVELDEIITKKGNEERALSRSHTSQEQL